MMSSDCRLMRIIRLLTVMIDFFQLGDREYEINKVKAEHSHLRLDYQTRLTLAEQNFQKKVIVILSYGSICMMVFSD